jgi:hypothetical protein
MSRNINIIFMNSDMRNLGVRSDSCPHWRTIISRRCPYRDCTASVSAWHMNVKLLVGWELAKETEVLGENTPKCHFVLHKSHIGMNPEIYMSNSYSNIGGILSDFRHAYAHTRDNSTPQCNNLREPSQNMMKALCVLNHVIKFTWKHGLSGYSTNNVWGCTQSPDLRLWHCPPLSGHASKL